MTIELTETEAFAFRTYLEHKDNIDIMLAANVFEVRRGSVELHFDAEGKIGVIQGHALLFKRDALVVVA